MRRLLIALLTALSVASAGCDTASGEADRQPRNRERAIDVVASGLTADPRADFPSDRDVRCVARGIVDRLGVVRLEELGLDLDAREAPMLYVPGLHEAERTLLAAAYDACLDLRRLSIEGYVAGGMSKAEARCVTDAYRASGIATVHLTEAPHGVSTVDIEPARRHLDEFLQAADAACRDWY